MSNITLFNKKYVVRHFGEQENINGYLASTYTDCIVSMNVHPLSSDQVQALPEGERNVRHLEGHSSDILTTADQKTNTQGDLLYYKGDWYECTSAEEWDHTVLSHRNYKFVLVPNDASNSTDLAPPTLNPDGNGGA